ncbi:hypothetical protein F4604DRAFT_1675481 [Suillus subluteus]|nr:hypothetical protein F4604DRAFT_1675481 [Suillus subluteus]
MSYSQHRCHSNDSHPSDRNDAADILLGYANTSNPAADDPFDGLQSLHDVSGDCTPGAGHLGYRDASDSDVDRAMKFIEKIEEEHYQQLKQDVDGWNAKVEDDTKFLSLEKRKRPCSDSGDIQARRKLWGPFESNPHAESPSKTLVEALSSIEMALERHNVILSRMCQAMENLNIK